MSPEPSPASNPYLSPEVGPDSHVVEPPPSIGPDAAEQLESIRNSLRQTYKWMRLVVAADFLYTARYFSFIGFEFARWGVEFLTMWSRAVLVFNFCNLAIGIYLWRTSSRVRRAANGGQMADLADAVDAQRLFWQLFGVITLLSALVLGGLTLRNIAIVLQFGG